MRALLGAFGYRRRSWRRPLPPIRDSTPRPSRRSTSRATGGCSRGAGGSSRSVSSPGRSSGSSSRSAATKVYSATVDDLSRPAVQPVRHEPGDHAADESVGGRPDRELADGRRQGRDAVQDDARDASARGSPSRRSRRPARRRRATAQVNPLVTRDRAGGEGKGGRLRRQRARSRGRGRDRVVSEAKIKNYTAQVADDKARDQEASARRLRIPTFRRPTSVILQTTLRELPARPSTYSGLLLQAKYGRVAEGDDPRRAHARSRAQSSRNTVLIAALIGLILGVIAALLWDRIVPRSPRATAARVGPCQPRS